MKQYVGLDVSLEETSVCVMDERGRIVFQGKALSTPEAIERVVRKRAPGAERVALESGPLSTWHWHGLQALGVPVVCLDARQVKVALSCHVNKTDDNDAEGLAQLACTGWYREVRVKSMQSHHARSLLAARSQLVKTKQDLENHMRGLLKTFGQPIGKVGVARFEGRVRDLLEKMPALGDVIEPLLAVRAAVRRELDALTKRVNALARESRACRILTGCPGIGPVTALTYASAIDDPTRFARSSSAGAYLGLTSRRYQSGEIDRAGKISKRGDAMVRSLLYEAAHVLLTRVTRWSPLKAWGMRLIKRIGPKKAKVAVARKMAVILHRMWMEEAGFRWSNKEVAA